MKNNLLISILFGVLISLSFVYAADCAPGTAASAPGTASGTADIPPPTTSETPEEVAAREAASAADRAKSAAAYQAAMEEVARQQAEAEATARAEAERNRRYDNTVQDVGEIFADAANIYQDISGNQYWLDRWHIGFGDDWEAMADELIENIFGEETFMGDTYCSEWIDNEGAPVSIIPGPGGSFAGHIEGRRSEAWIVEDGQPTRTFIYIITMSLTPQGLLQNPQEFLEADIYVTPGNRPVMFDSSGTNRIRLQGTAGEFRLDSGSMIVIQDVREQYDSVCLAFTEDSFNRFTNEVRDLMGSRVICNQFIFEEAPQTSETGIWGIGTPAGNIESATASEGSSSSESQESRPTPDGGVHIG